MVQVQCWHRFGMFLISEYIRISRKQSSTKHPSAGHSQEIIEIIEIKASRRIEALQNRELRKSSWPG